MKIRRIFIAACALVCMTAFMADGDSVKKRTKKKSGKKGKVEQVADTTKKEKKDKYKEAIKDAKIYDGLIKAYMTPKQELLFEFVYALKVAVAVQLGANLHSVKGRPALGIYYIGVLERLFHVVRLSEAAAALLCVRLGDLFDLGHHIVALGMSQHYVHAEACEQSDDSLRYRQRLAVAGRVCPCHGYLLALEVLYSAEVMDDMVEVGESLSGMVDVALQVDQRGLLLQHSVLIALF